MRSVFLQLQFVFFCFCTNAQSSETYYTVITEKDTPVKSGLGGTMEPLRIVSINKEENSQIVSYSFDMRHQLFAAYKKKQLSADSLQLFQQQYLLDTVHLKKWEKENEMLVYLQLLKGKWKIIFDTNHSGTFTDDPVYFKDTSFFANRRTFAIPHKLNFWHQQPYTKELTFQILPDGQLPKKYPDALFNTWGGARKLRQGRLHVGVDSFLIKLYVVNKHLAYSLYSSIYSVSNANENEFQLFSTSYPQYSRKDSLYIGNEILMLDKVSIMGDTMVFRKVGENEAMKGLQPGAILKSVFGAHLNTGVYEDIYFKRRDSKYTLLHFWGSWCGPCIANLPKLKTFVTANEAKIEIISFPFELQQDTHKTKKLVEQYKLNWKQIIQLRDHPFQKPEVVKQLRIEHFPTYLLFDSLGKILVRTSKLEEVTDIFR
ncbi:MAG: TlpA family protein disulfide reductase [Chitinophagaceae bacterium]|nr:TlpA family protein disulfide reductase [Chitinophagaceae bacterium]